MNNIININEHSDHPAIEAEARAWVIRMDGVRPAEQDINEFREWLNRSPLHKREFKRMADIWVGMDDLSERFFSLMEPDMDTREEGDKKFYLKPVFASVIAVIAVVSILAGIYFTHESRRTSEYSVDYATITGEIKDVSLPDGSEIQLNTRSKVNVDYETEVRNVYLLEGEAHFKVAHNPDKPFIVYAGKYSVKAVGTAFNVYLKGNSLDLTVTHGRVEVSLLKKAVLPGRKPVLPQGDNLQSLVPFVEGQHVVMDKEIELVQKLSPGDIEKKLSWRDGLLVFDAEKLKDVVSRINRYIPTKIVISDPTIANIKFGGHFKVGEIDSILSALEEQFGIRVERVNKKLIYLSRKLERHPVPAG
jgi:transmembrane sensor